MWAAANTDLKNARGVKTLLVLTDDADTRFKKNLAFIPMQNTIPQFLKTYLNRFGARINLVFFTAALEKPEELARAKADFEIPLKTLDPPGSFIAADDFDQLLRSLRQGIRQKRRARSSGLTAPPSPKTFWRSPGLEKKTSGGLPAWSRDSTRSGSRPTGSTNRKLT